MMTVMQVVELMDMTMYPMWVVTSGRGVRFNGYDEIASADDSIKELIVDFITKSGRGEIQIWTI